MNYENMKVSEVVGLAKQGNGGALFEMAWRFEVMPSEISANDPSYRCAWQDYWFEKAADAGHIDARSRFARSLINRIFDADDRKKAMKYFESLAKDFDAGKLNGNEDHKLDGIISKLWLGIMLCQGLGTRRDASEGAKLLKDADTLTKGFEGFGYGALSKIAETYAQGCVKEGGEPSVDDLRQAISYQKKAIHRFDAKRDDPNNRGFLELAEEYLEKMEQRKKIKESQRDNASALGINTSTVNSDFVEWQNGMMSVSSAAQQRKDADKAALTRLRQLLAREGW
jgi:TPR repeat protein